MTFSPRQEKFPALNNKSSQRAACPGNRIYLVTKVTIILEPLFFFFWIDFRKIVDYSFELIQINSLYITGFES